MTALEIIQENIDMIEYFIARDAAEIELAKAVYTNLPLVPYNAGAHEETLYGVACEGLAHEYRNIFGRFCAVFYLDETHRRLMGTSADTIYIFESGEAIWL